MSRQPASPIRDERLVWDIQDYLKVSANRPSEGERNYMLFTIGVTTGYRAGDLVELRVRDARDALKNGFFEIDESKTQRFDKPKRRAELVDRCAKELRKYVKGRKDYEWLFPSRKGNGHITAASYSRILNQAASYFGIKHITGHSMRKTYAYRLYERNNKDIALVSQMLTHRSIDWTKRYIGLDDERYHEAVQCLNSFVR